MNKLKAQISNFKNDAYRIIEALTKGSIRYLKGMNPESFTLLTQKGIYLIRDLLEIREKPDEIEELKWQILLEDAERILS